MENRREQRERWRTGGERETENLGQVTPFCSTGLKATYLLNFYHCDIAVK